MSRDKRLTLRQTVRIVQDAYDRFEVLALQVLRDDFGFGAGEIARFEEALSERAAQECLRIEARLRR